ncbi:hypothetical protein CJ178_13785 [Rhodococcus sp. ACPA4]|nr:hypothetical protein CJ178_13785 [Rhodococcus sp. ACPA4]
MDWRFPVDPDGDVAFTAPLSGRASVSTDKFVSAITDFDYRLLEAMQVRVDTIAATDVLSGFDLDIPGLIREQAERRTWLSQAMAHQVNTDWDAVRAGASFLLGIRGEFRLAPFTSLNEPMLQEFSGHT